jgi:hypothetical protein
VSWRAWLRRLAWPISITLVVFVGWAGTDTAVYASYGALQAPAMALVRPTLYVAFAPLSDVLDAITLLSVPGLIGFGASLILSYAAWRVIRWRLRGASGWCEFCAGLRALLILMLTIVLAAVLPRPMAALRVMDPEWVIYDIHSHTNFSHDARATFTVERNREWHRGAGFDAAYITDHRCFDGAAEGMRANPKLAGEGTVLLSGVELPADQLHLVVLEPTDAEVPQGFLEAWCVRAGRGQTPRGPVVRIQTIPEDLTRAATAMSDPAFGVSAIEVSDGAPRGIAQAERDARRIRELTFAHHLAPVAGSNNHGWGRTAAAWNILRIPGWRRLTPSALAAEIEARLRAPNTDAVVVVERDASSGGAGAMALLAPLQVIIGITTTISDSERISWLAWTWGITGIVVFMRRRRA